MARRGLGVVLALMAGSAAEARQKTAPVATYWVTADTERGGQGGLSAIGAAFGRAPSTSARHSLRLQLSSNQGAPAAPSAEHLPPAGLRAGQRLPLVTPPVAPKASADGHAAERPKGRILLFWGCGDQARQGQPAVVDIARPTAIPGLIQGLAALLDTPPGPGGGRTYGEWPNARAGGGQIPMDGSLVGEHLVRGNYLPEIRFRIDPGQDFLPPLELTGTSPTAKGVTPLAWREVTGARGYLAAFVGADERGDTVIWTSSEVPLMAGQPPDHLSPDSLARLVAQKVVMGPQARGCVVPAQVVKTAPAAMLRVVAYGGEATFSYPPRPADPRAAWKLEHVVKVRYASGASAMLGLDDPGQDPEGEAEGAAKSSTPLKKSTGRLLRGLGGLVP